MATAKKLPSGNWNARAFYKDPITGKISRPSFSAGTKSEALRKAHEWEAKKEQHTDTADLTVAEAIEQYITLNTAAMSPSTIKGYRVAQRNYFDQIGHRRVKDLNDADLQAYISDLCARYSPKTVRNAYSLLLPSLHMFTKRIYDVTLPAKVPKEYHIPTDAQVRELQRAARPQMRKAIALGAVGSLRLGEVCALRFQDIDHDRCGIWVRHDMVQDENNEWILKDMPKNATSYRFIPMPPTVIQMLGEGEPDAFIYPHTPNALSRAFRRLCERSDMTYTFHDLRRFAISRMHALGVPDQYIQERSGHKTDSCLKAVYRLTISDQSQKFADLANEHFGTLF